MKIALISPYSNLTSFGIRTISSYLRQMGHSTQMIFLPDISKSACAAGARGYDDEVLKGIVPLCDDCDIIGITLMTNFYGSAVQITKMLRSRLSKPIIWGGIHPTIRPEECLKYADIVCIGEGEEVVCELLNRMGRDEPYEDTKNVWLKKNGTILKNPLRPLAGNLDVYPMPDYSCDGHYLMYENKIQPMTPDLLRSASEESPLSNWLNSWAYQTMTSRGCPHKCTYCVNDTLKELYGKKDYLRWRGVEHIIKELLWIKRKMPFVGYIWFSDDSFFARRKEDMEGFCVRYKKEIKLPFYALGSPLTLTEDKMDMLVEAGLVCIQMGIQTGSRRMLEVFHREHMTNEKTLKAIRIINSYKAKMLPPHYDFILNSPFETEQDEIESLRFISHIPKPYMLHTFSMVLYPGTQLYRTAKAEGIIDNEVEEIYNKISGGNIFDKSTIGYLDFLFFLVRKGWFPGWLIRVLVSAPPVWVLNRRMMNPLFRVIVNSYHFVRGFLGRRHKEKRQPACS